MIEYRNGDLFSAPTNAVLAHACNAQGVWGSGVAKEFKKRFPLAFKEYEQFCIENLRSRELCGQSFLCTSDKQKVGCLITSHRYGADVDSPAEIMGATTIALSQLLSQLKPGEELHIPKINSGLFHVPWLDTEKCIEYCLSIRTDDVKIVVWDNTRQ